MPITNALSMRSLACLSRPFAGGVEANSVDQERDGRCGKLLREREFSHRPARLEDEAFWCLHPVGAGAGAMAGFMILELATAEVQAEVRPRLRVLQMQKGRTVISVATRSESVFF